METVVQIERFKYLLYLRIYYQELQVCLYSHKDIYLTGKNQKSLNVGEMVMVL